MNFKKLMLPVAAMSLVLAGCNTPSKATWSSSTKKLLGVALPEIDYQFDYSEFYVEDDQFVFYGEVLSFDEAGVVAESYDTTLTEAGFIGTYSIDAQEEYLSGSYACDGPKEVKYYGEKFSTTIVVEFSFEYDLWGYAYFTVTAYLDANYKDSSEVPFDKIANIVGADRQVEYLAGTSYGYRYIYDSYYYETYFELKTYTSSDPQLFVDGLFAQHWYMEEADFEEDGYRYYSLPWTEDYEMTIIDYGQVPGSEGNYYFIASYGYRTPALIENAFPGSDIADYLELPSGEASNIIEIASLTGFGYKSWFNRSYPDYYYLDVIDPACESLGSQQLIDTYAETLLENGFSPRKDCLGDQYFKKIGNDNLLIAISEESYYVTLTFSYGVYQEPATTFPAENVISYFAEEGITIESLPSYVASGELACFKSYAGWFYIEYQVDIYNSTEEEMLAYKDLLLGNGWSFVKEEEGVYNLRYGETSLYVNLENCLARYNYIEVTFYATVYSNSL